MYLQNIQKICIYEKHQNIYAMCIKNCLKKFAKFVFPNFFSDPISSRKKNSSQILKIFTKYMHLKTPKYLRIFQIMAEI